MIKMEWTVVSVIVVIAGLIGTVAVPLSKNTKAMTQLSERINHLVYRMDKEENELDDFKNKSADKHKQIFKKLDEHETKLNIQEGRIYALEKSKIKEKNL